ADVFMLDSRPENPSRARALLDAAGGRAPGPGPAGHEIPPPPRPPPPPPRLAAPPPAARAAPGPRQPAEGGAAPAPARPRGPPARSVPGGWAVWENETARQVFPPSHWDLRFCVAVCASGPKQVGSRDGMRLSRETSPYHAAFIEQCRRDLPAALQLLSARD